MPANEPTTFIQLTARGRSAIACLRIEGPSCANCLRELFAGSVDPGTWTTDRIHLVRCRPPLAEEVVAARRSDTAFEIHCHGGHAAVAAITKRLEQLGAVPQTTAGWLEKNEPCTIQAEARTALIHATTERTARILLEQYQGALDRAMGDLVNAMDRRDYDRARRQLSELLRYQHIGLHLTTPYRIALVGPTNAGKSTLLNAIVGYQRSLVHPEPGTTRDVVSVATAIDGWPCELLDTAGSRETLDHLENAGMRLADQAAAQADLVVICAPRDQPWRDVKDRFRAKFPNSLLVTTKADLATHSSQSSSPIQTSAVANSGIDALLAEIIRLLVREVPPPGAAVPFSTRQISALERALASLDANRPADAMRDLQALLS